MVKRIISLIVTLVIVAWAVILFLDYFKVQKSEKPQFCLKEVTHEYDDGTVYECTGLGYKAFIYDRGGVKASEFGPFFIKEKEPSEFETK